MRSRWDIRRGRITTRNIPDSATRKLLVAGWEPFAASGAFVFLRKRVRSR